MGTMVVGVLQSSVTVVQGVGIPGGTLDVISLLGRFLAEVRSVRIPQHDGWESGCFFFMSMTWSARCCNASFTQA